MRLILFLNVLNAAKAADFVTEDQKAVRIKLIFGHIRPKKTKFHSKMLNWRSKMVKFH